jgi:hypothetical protein
MRGSSCRARQAHGAAADVDDALLLPQQVQPLGGFFGKADGALGVGAVIRIAGTAGWPVRRRAVS